jgi:hypothetical protein
MLKIHISKERVAASMMAWNGTPLNWSRFLYNNMKVELVRMSTRDILALHSALYLTEMMNPTQPLIPNPPTVNSKEPRSDYKVGSSSSAKKKKAEVNQKFIIQV